MTSSSFIRGVIFSLCSLTSLLVLVALPLDTLLLHLKAIALFLFINKLCTWHWICTVDKKWAEVSLREEETSWRKKNLGKGSMVTAFPSKWDRKNGNRRKDGWLQNLERGRVRSPDSGQKYYKQTHHLALRFRILFPNNALWQLVPRITEHAKIYKKKRTTSRKEVTRFLILLPSKTWGRENSADVKCISMIHFFLCSRFQASRESLFQACGFLTKLTYLLLQNNLLLSVVSISFPPSLIFLRLKTGSFRKGDQKESKFRFHLRLILLTELSFEADFEMVEGSNEESSLKIVVDFCSWCLTSETWDHRSSS